MQVPADDRRPTGPAQLRRPPPPGNAASPAASSATTHPPSPNGATSSTQLAPQIRGDDFTPLLAERLAAMSRAGLPARQLLRTARSWRSLPDEHAAAALWWRMARHLTPAVADQVDDSATAHARQPPGWTDQLPDLLGTDRADAIQASPWWPALVANVDHGLHAAGSSRTCWTRRRHPASQRQGVDDCQALVWRTSIVARPRSPTSTARRVPGSTRRPMTCGTASNRTPHDATDVSQLPDLDLPMTSSGRLPTTRATIPTATTTTCGPGGPRHHLRVDERRQCRPGRGSRLDLVERDLRLAGYVRDCGPTALEPTDADIA